MRSRKILGTMLAVVMAASALTGCGSSSSTKKVENDQPKAAEEKKLNYADIKVGEDFKDLKTTIHFYNCRTDMDKEDYPGKNWKAYVADFNKLYPDIKVEVESDTDFANNALVRLQGGDWGDIMYIPAVDKKELSTYFLPYGETEAMKKQVKYANAWEYKGQCYGVACMGNALGMVYNKAVFNKAGITQLPKTPEEFINDLQAIKDKTDATPLYTNYAAKWTLGAWDAYIGVTATGDAKFMNQTLLHSATPFSDPGNGTGPYNVYKLLYEAVNKGLTEEDYSTTDWEGSKGMLNSGKIGCMALGSWAYSQMKAAGDHPEDVGYMPFPISVDGKQYTVSAGDYNYGINVKSSADNQKAAMLFVKWLTEKSGWANNEGAMGVAANDNTLPETYSEFKDVTFIEDEPSVSGEEDVLNTLNADSELMVNNGGNDKVLTIVEHAAKKDKGFDDIMNEWNKKWSEAQKQNSIEQK
ncbi:MAG: ABC transporter substrate-binding protein [bacterium]|nr:ABC transporter substrate-binding protein [bacterium]